MMGIAATGRTARGQAVAVVVALTAAAAHAGGGTLTGFEDVTGLTISGKATRVSGADAVTEGANALQLDPGASVRLSVPAGAVGAGGWLRMDTLEPRPVLGCLQVRAGRSARTGYVQPGKDVLALPVSVFADGDRGPWPVKETSLTITNAGPHPVVLDHVRLDEPEAPPEGSVLVDFGPDRQVVWPAFSPGGAETGGVVWSGEGTIVAPDVGHPDPLTGDFAGRIPSYRSMETVMVTGPRQAGRGWLWVTHYSSEYSAPLEYMVKVNGKTALHERTAASRMLTPEALLTGRREPWTPRWLDETFVPRVVSRVEAGWQSGSNRVELANCQLAAMLLAPGGQAEAAGAYVGRIEADLKRYRRQFVLADRRPPRCDVVPTEEQSKAGLMVFVPPDDEALWRGYAGAPEHSGQAVKIAATAGGSGMGTFVAVPCRDGRTLRAVAGMLRGPKQAGIQPGQIRVDAFEAVPVVDEAAVHYQPFVAQRELRDRRAQEVCWFAVKVSVPAVAPSGPYRGAVRVLLDGSEASVPVEVDVVHFPESVLPAGGVTFGVRVAPDSFHAYHSLAEMMPPDRRAAEDRRILKELAESGLTACGMTGPALVGKQHVLSVTALNESLKNRLWLGGGGRNLISMANVLSQSGIPQPGTTRYGEMISEVVREVSRAAARARFEDYALFCGSVYRSDDLAETIRIVQAVRSAGGRPALYVSPSVLKSSQAAWGELFAAVDTLIVSPDGVLPSLAAAMRKDAPSAVLAVQCRTPDAYTTGFYCWGAGADGAYADYIVPPRPAYNAFWFDGRGLLVPDERAELLTTAAMGNIAQGMADYRLARRCEALAEAARKRNVDPRELDRILTEIRLAAARNTPSFDLARLRSTQVSPAQMQQWRFGLVSEAAKLVEKLSAPGGS